MNIKKLFVLAVIFCFITALSVFSPGNNSLKASFHTPEELESFRTGSRIPIQPGEYFLPSFRCKGCHGYDSAGLANIVEGGMDVNLVDRWESSMMAMSAVDPFWRAKVSHEILVNPGHSGPLQDKCTSCHAPMGRYTRFFHNEGHYGLADIDGDSLGVDGVSCAGCHTISPTVGLTFSGEIPFDTFPHVIYGPFTDPHVGPMQLYEGYTPTFSAHMDESRVCSSCHTLITETADLSGNATGGEFVEQATYHEYLNSSFPANDIKCQTCHMPQIEEPIIIANGFSGLTPRAPFNQHTFEGANFYMLQLIKQNKQQIGVTVEDVKFDSTIAATKRMLKNRSVGFELFSDSVTLDTAYFRVRIENKAGHKFPSGYPSRRAVLQFVVFDENNDTLFKSGIFTPTFRVNNEDPQFEAHHNIINQSGVSQIYEMVMGDVNSDFTSVLERGAVLLKDNRIPPLGFTTQHYTYDTVRVSADALADVDFNKVNSVEGSATDFVHFHVPVTGYTGNIKVKTTLFYQTLPPKWLDEMFNFNSTEINAFRTMFQNADGQPLAVAADSLEDIPLITGISSPTVENDLLIFPSLSLNGIVNLQVNRNLTIDHINVFSSDGKLVNSISVADKKSKTTVQLPLASGVYYISVQTGKNTFCRKVVRQ